MSRICRNMGDSGKLWSYELDHESKMRLLKTHSHTSNGLAIESGTREENVLKETQTLQQGKPPIKNLPRTADVAGGGQKRLCGKPTTEKYYGEASARRYGGKHRRYYKRDVISKTSRGPSAWRGVRRGNDKYPGWKVASPTAPPAKSLRKQPSERLEERCHNSKSSPADDAIL